MCHCGCSDNWASRVKCKRCGKDAPPRTKQQAIEAHKAAERRGPANKSNAYGKQRTGKATSKWQGQDAEVLEEMESLRAQLAELKLKHGQQEDSAKMETDGDAEPAKAAKPKADICKLHNDVERFKKD